MAGTLLAPYPVSFDVDYPERQSRWKTFFRLPLVLPAWLFAGLAWYAALLLLPLMWLAVLVRGRIPRWLFDFEVGVYRFNVRVQSYLSLLTDVYPAWDGDYPARYEVAYPQRVRRRQLVVWKFAAALPQWIAVTLLQYAGYAVVAVGWLVILFTGRFPKGLHSFVVGVTRWRERVWAYSVSLTDDYPPYSLAANASATRGPAYLASSAVGALAIGGLVAGIVSLFVFVPFGGEERVLRVSYERLLAGEVAPGDTLVEVNGIGVELLSAIDPADDIVGLIAPDPGYRFVLFSILLTNNKASGQQATVYAGDFSLADRDDDDRYPVLAVVDRRSPPISFVDGQTLLADVVFEVPAVLDPLELSFDQGFLSDAAVFDFR
jgi:hypothetical protein